MLDSPAGRLDQALKLLGIPIAGVVLNEGKLTVQYLASATGGQVAQGDALAAGFDVRIRVQRTLYSILQDLLSLTALQKLNVHADLFGGYPPKWSRDAGPNAGALLCLYFDSLASTLSVSDRNQARLYAAALYVQDNPMYLVQPGFDPTVNVPGDAP